MGTAKNNLYLFAIIIILTILNISLIVEADKVFKEKPFTYEDGVALYNMCKKKGGSKEAMYNRVYEDKRTDFREFLLGK
jgi:hypothetical protein